MTLATRVLALSGGVGGAKMAQGLLENLEHSEQLTVVCNTADDFEHLGLHIAPDLDSVMYRLANLHDEKRGWGHRDESWNCLEAVKALGGPTWFQLGDRDLATHVLRTTKLRNGETLSEITEQLCRALEIPCQVVPMSDDAVRTVVLTTQGPLDFQDYFVKERCEPVVTGFRFEGIKEARISPGFHQALESTQLELVVLCPSNPYVSMDPILAMEGVEAKLAALNVPIVAISPILGGQALKGPAAKMMLELGKTVSALSVAKHYVERGIISHFLIDPVDRAQASDIEDLGIEVLTVPAVLHSRAARRSVTQALIHGTSGPATKRSIG